VKTYIILIYPVEYPADEQLEYHAGLTGDQAALVRDRLARKLRLGKIRDYSVSPFAPISYPELMKYIDEVGE
jgi:hypothetical protein